MKRKFKHTQIAYYVLSFAAVIAMMTVIYRFSASPAPDSSNLSGGVCEKIVSEAVRIFRLSWDKAQQRYWAEALETPIRKCAHFTEYAFLGILLRIHQESLGFLGYRVRLHHGILFGCLYAATDELHQYFVPGRACRLMDVGIDTAGAAFGILLAEFILFRFLKSRRNFGKEAEETLTKRRGKVG